MDLSIGAYAHIRSKDGCVMDVSCWMDEALSQYLVLFQFVWFLKQFRASHAIVLEVDVLAG